MAIISTIYLFCLTNAVVSILKEELANIIML